MTPFQKRKLEEFRETFVIDNSDYKILCNRLPEPIEDFLLKALQEQRKEDVDEVKIFLTEYMKKIYWSDRDIKYLLNNLK